MFVPILEHSIVEMSRYCRAGKQTGAPMISFRNRKAISDILFLVGGVLLVTFFFAGDELSKYIQGYILLKNILMTAVVIVLLSLRPKIDKYVFITLLVLLVRYYVGSYLKAKTDWYLLVSFPVTVFLLGFLVVREVILKPRR